jgi:hypothetical protein
MAAEESVDLNIRVIDTCPRPGYPYFVGGRVDSEPEAGDSMPREKTNFLYLK